MDVLYDSRASKQQAVVIVDDKGEISLTPTSIVGAFRSRSASSSTATAQ